MTFNPIKMFRRTTTQEQDSKLISSADTIKDMEELSKLGKEMLSDARYLKYKENFDKLLGTLIKDLINYRCADNNTYSANVRTIIQQVKDLLALIDTPISFLNYVTMQQLELSAAGTKEGGPYAGERTP